MFKHTFIQTLDAKSSYSSGTDTLHGGVVGFDRRVWNLVKQSKSSLTFEYYDPAGTEGFPGAVTTTVS